MALVVNTNIASLTAQNNATSSRQEMETAMERLSSGKRINSAADDAAGLAISTRMDSQIRGLSKAVQNANDGISLAQTAEGAQSEITEMLQRMRELALQSSNSTLNATDRASLDAEVQQLKDEIDAIAENTTFNNQKLIDGSFDAKLQIGDQVEKSMEFSVASMKVADLGLGSNSTGNSNTLISARVGDLDAAAGGLSTVLQGDIKINGQEVGDLSSFETAADAQSGDIADVVNVINDSIDNVEASAFNTVTMKNVGDGVASAGDVSITVSPVNQATDTVATDLVFSLDASESIEEMRDNINAVANGVVTASLNDQGKLVLSNDTGATISVTDGTSGANGALGTATGLGAAGPTAFNGMIQLESTDGSDIRVEKGNLDSVGATDAELALLGFREIGDDDTDTQTYSVTGTALSQAQATLAFSDNDLKINGVDVYDADIDTTSIQGKLDGINAASDETGVTASAYFEKFYDLSDVDKAAASAAATISFNGVTVAFSTDYSTFVDNINALSDQIGVEAELHGTSVIELSGNVSSLSVEPVGAASGVAGFGSAAADVFGANQDFAGIRLTSIDGSPISVDLGETAGATNLAVSTAASAFGFLESNVGAADFDINDPFVGGAAGSNIAGLNVLSATNAANAIEAIDRAIQQVSDSSSQLGAIQNRLDHVVSNLQETIVNTSASQSRILDADFAAESAELAKQQVLQQASTAMLAQANSSSQSVLTLLGG